MKKLTFVKYQIEKKTPMKHAVLGVRACDSEGEVFKVEHDELSNDFAYSNHTDVVRNLLTSGYQEVS